MAGQRRNRARWLPAHAAVDKRRRPGGILRGQLLPVVIALAVTLLTRAAANVNRLSMHDFYRWRLANAFATTRQAAEEQDPAQARARFADAAATRLSELRDQPEPGDLRHSQHQRAAGGAARPGRLLRHVRPGLCDPAPGQGPGRPEEGRGRPEEDPAVERARARTSDYEALLGHRRSTLFDISAISGAAVSPLMGSMTQHAYRILLTATNVRLGVWLPHPNVVRNARQLIDHPDMTTARGWERHPLLLLPWYLRPHPLWDRQAADENSGRDAAAVGPRAPGAGSAAGGQARCGTGPCSPRSGCCGPRPSAS